MAKNDKIIIAFLVSMGLFSAGQATQYVNGLSMKDKKVMVSVVKGETSNISVCEVGEPSIWPVGKKAA